MLNIYFMFNVKKKREREGEGESKMLKFTISAANKFRIQKAVISDEAATDSEQQQKSNFTI